MPDTASIDALRPEIWQKALYEDRIDNLYFTQNKMMGGDENNIVQILPDLKKEKGDTITLGLTSKMSGEGVDGDNELEGNEERLLPYSESISIDQHREGVRLTGKLDERKNAYDMRKDAKNKLTVKMDEFIERQIFLKLGGVTLTTVTDINGVVVSKKATWSNTPTKIADADTAAGTGARYLCANSGGADAMTADDKLTPALIMRARIKAANCMPKIKPLKIKGQNWWVMFVHSWQMYDLMNNAVMTAALRDAWWRGDENPLFHNASLVWNQVIIHEHEYCPFLDVSVVGNNFNAAASGTNYAVDTFRALLCGQQAIGYAECTNTNGWVEESFDYKNKVGFATGTIGGIDKVMFNSKEYGVITVDTAATNLS